MSSTQMDLSPQVIERKQDISAWPEGDITQLTVRDKARYRKRKSAIEEYFKTDASIEEISLRYRISPRESLEELTKRCFMLHEDGQNWGFRALVPGVEVIDRRASVALDGTENDAKMEAPTASSDVSEQQDFAVTTLSATQEEDEEDTAKSRAIQMVVSEPTKTATSGTMVANDEAAKVEETGPVAVGDLESIEELPVQSLDVQTLERTALVQNEPEYVPTEESEENIQPEMSAEESSVQVKVVEQEAVDEPIADPDMSVGEREDISIPVAEAGEYDAPAIEGESGETAILDTVEVAEVDAEEEQLEQVSAIETVKISTIAVSAEEEQREQVAAIETLKVSTVETSVEEEQREQVAAIETLKVSTVETSVEEEQREQVAAIETLKVSIIETPSEEKQREQVAAIETLKVSTVETSAEGEKQIEHEQLADPVTSATTAVPPERQETGTPEKLEDHSPAVESKIVTRYKEWYSKQQGHRRWVKIVCAAVIATLLVILLIPLCVGLVGYNAYTNIKSVANDGMLHLMAIKELIPANKNDLTSVLNVQKLEQAKADLSKAQGDFLQLQDMVNRPDIQSLLQDFAPSYSRELGMARHLLQAALDVSNMGQELIGVAEMGANIIHGSPLTGDSNKPLLSADNINTVEATVVHAQYYIGDIQTQMSQVNLSQLPLGSASQKAQLAKYLQALPQVQSTITQVQSLAGPVAWLLGIGQQRRFLVQTLDRGELRPSGGFEGQYGILTLQNGRMSPFSLTDVTKIDYAENGAELGAHPPAQYSWMDFGDFGVRDANLSADYPTTAQLVMRTFEQLGGGPLDGDIQITPVVIEQFLQLTGPLYIADYQETVTAQNLETKIHAYQQNYQLIDKQVQVTGTDTHQTRKAFTNLLGQMMMARIKKLSVAQLIDFGKILLKDLKSRDLQIYFTNPVAEQWLTQNEDSGAMPSFTNGTDGFMVVQANISISKAAEFVHSTFKDQVLLDAQGGATHNLTITLDYQKGDNPVYGFNSYADYLRVYAPPNAQLIDAYGFNTGRTLCVPTSKPPSKNPGGQGNGGNGNGNGNGSGSGTNNDPGGSYVDTGFTIYGCGAFYHTSVDSSSRYCPDGNYELGYDGMMAKPWPVQELGRPTEMTSDLPGYSMWGGLTLTPMNCTSTITLQWYVPHIVQNIAGQPPYQMIVGHQAGWPDTAQVNIDPSALNGIKSLSYNQTIDVDTLIALANRPLPPVQGKQSSPTPVVTPTTGVKKKL